MRKTSPTEEDCVVQLHSKIQTDEQGESEVARNV